MLPAPKLSILCAKTISLDPLLDLTRTKSPLVETKSCGRWCSVSSTTRNYDNNSNNNNQIIYVNTIELAPHFQHFIPRDDNIAQPEVVLLILLYTCITLYKTLNAFIHMTRRKRHGKSKRYALCVVEPTMMKRVKLLCRFLFCTFILSRNYVGMYI